MFVGRLHFHHIFTNMHVEIGMYVHTRNIHICTYFTPLYTYHIYISKLSDSNYNNRLGWAMSKGNFKFKLAKRFVLMFVLKNRHDFDLVRLI